LTAGIRIGLIAAATTAGALVGLGLRHGAAAQPFLLTGRAFADSTLRTEASPLVAAILGVGVHAFWMILWGVCFAALVPPPTRVRGVVVAALLAALVGVLASSFLPGALGAAALAALTVPQTVFLLTLFGLSLVFGARVSRVPS
jgi:hypothetical protein